MRRSRHAALALVALVVALAAPAHAQTRGNAASDFTLPCAAGVPWVGGSGGAGTPGQCGSGSWVTSVGLGLPSSIFAVTGSPVTGSGTLTGTLVNQSANTFFAGPSSGSATAPAFRPLTGADLPAPTASSLGGVEAYSAPTHQWLNAISTGGVPAASQPTFADIAGTASTAQLPTSGVTPGSYGSATAIPVVTVNGEGQVTAATTAALSSSAAFLPGAVNLRERLTSAATSTSVIADAVAVCTAAGGTCYVLGSYSETFNGGTTGAGGMDTGSLPSGSYVALYAIYNPTAPAVSILGTSCASACPTFYAGTLPSGYTASVLLTVLPTNSTPAIIAQSAVGKWVYLVSSVNVLNSSSTSLSCTSMSLSGAVPPAAVAFGAYLSKTMGTSPTAGSYTTDIWADSTCSTIDDIFEVYFDETYTRIIVNSDMPILTAQTVYVTLTASGSSPSSGIDVISYRLP